MFSRLTTFLFTHTPLLYLIQSVWRDEAFSYFMAKPSVLRVIANTANDFNPPLYYLLLHFWEIFAGRTDELMRVLSFLPHLGTTYVAFLFARKLTNKKFSYFVALFTFLNPMLLYYAFEIRMYSFYAFFAICSMYFFYLRKWDKYLLTTVLGLYTHSFFALIPASYLLYLYLVKQLTKKTFWLTVKPFLFFLVWVPVLVNQFLRSKDSWIFPVDFQLIKSVLGNLFTSYEGTPGGLWPFTALLSMVILWFFFLGLRRHRKQALFLIIPVTVPLFLILGYSVFRRPIYVNRYLIFVTVFEVMAMALGIWSIKNRTLRSVISWLSIFLLLIFNIIISPYHKKTDFKTTFREINMLARPDDYVYTKTPIGFLESAYYFKYQTRVFVYNPNRITIPNYIGVSVVFPNVSIEFFPKAPSRTFVVADDADYEVMIEQ